MSKNDKSTLTLKVHLFPHIHRMEEELGRNLTNREIAARAGVHESTLSTYKNGAVKMVRLETLQKLARFFECRPGELLSEEVV